MPRVELVELHARGLGPVRDARIHFGPGFNVITGETGAGKTLLVGALSLCIGESDARLRGDELHASAIFAVGRDEIAFTRESGPGGRLRGAIDATATSAEAMRTRSTELIVIHGQHDSLRLRSRGEVLRLIDDFGGIDDRALEEMRATRRELEDRRARHGGDPAARRREEEFLRFQLAEIDAVAPSSADELDECVEQLVELSALRDSLGDTLRTIEVLDGDSDDSVLSRFAAGLRDLPDAGRIGEIRHKLSSLLAESREHVRELAAVAENIELDPEALERLEHRVGALRDLARKHGGTLGEVFGARERFAKELRDLEQSAADLSTIDADIEDLSRRIEDESARLRAARERAALAFVEAVSRHLPRVALTNAAMEVRVGGDDGSEVELLFSSAPGLASGPIGHLASGGELSRVLLAISLETVSNGVVAVFDEVDAGIGGSVAQQIGECLKELASRQQVIVVTHLASVAARADRHFVIEKSPEGLDTTVREVRGEERVSEIARMLSGESELAESRALATRLLTGI